MSITIRPSPNRILIDPFHHVTEIGDSGGDGARQFESTVNDVDGIATVIVVEPCDDEGAFGALGSVSIVEEHTGVNACRLPPYSRMDEFFGERLHAVQNSGGVDA